MTEIVRGNQVEALAIWQELHSRRFWHEMYVKQSHPTTTFVTLQEIITDEQYDFLVNRSLLKSGISQLRTSLSKFGNFNPLNLNRVWVGVKSTAQRAFGGFHHPNQGYRYIQKTSILSMVGGFSTWNLPVDLVAIELVRAYAHDTLHHNSFRLYRPMQAEAATKSAFGFYRFQYGINFRRWDGRTYSGKDPLKRKTTRNLGVIMEASVDRFAQELAQGVATTSKLEEQNEWTDFVGRECLGQLTEEDLKKLKRIKKSPNKYNRPDSVRDYLKNLRLFAEYVSPYSRTHRTHLFTVLPYSPYSRTHLPSPHLPHLPNGKVI